MTKEEYLELLKQPNIPMYVLFEYYKERGGILEDILDFQHILMTLVENRSTVEGSDGVLKEITPESVYRNFTEYYNKKFEIE